MTLLFAGDLAWPQADILDYQALRELADGAAMVVNLEGALLAGPAQECAVNNDYKFNLYSDASATGILRHLNVRACGLANNHISDYKGGLAHTRQMLDANGIAAFGTRALPHCELQVAGTQYILFGACSALPEPGTEGSQDSAMPFDPAAALAMLARLRQQFPAAKLVAFLHWGYELARFPQPADREWARQAIDAGADLVIGHHPHVVQGYERYRHGAIAYSLGNAILPQTQYRGRLLHYKTPYVCEQLVLAVADDGVTAHWLRYHPQEGRLTREGSAAAGDDAHLRERTPFAGMDDAQYRAWFASTGRLDGNSGHRYSYTFWSYRGWRQADSALKFALLRARRSVRKLAIRSGLHKPYNW